MCEESTVFGEVRLFVDKVSVALFSEECELIVGVLMRFGTEVVITVLEVSELGFVCRIGYVKKGCGLVFTLYQAENTKIHQLCLTWILIWARKNCLMHYLTQEKAFSRV